MPYLFTVLQYDKVICPIFLSILNMLGYITYLFEYVHTQKDWAYNQSY